jgi:hypothetical protein
VDVVLKRERGSSTIRLINFELTNDIALAEFQPAIYTRHFHCLVCTLYGKRGTLGSFPNTTHHIRHSIVIFMHARIMRLPLGMLQIVLDPLSAF